MSDDRARLPRVKLTGILANLFPREKDARMVVDQSGLDETRIEFDGRADVTWRNIVKAAIQRRKLDALVGYVVESHYPERSEELYTLLAECKRTEEIAKALLGEMNFALAVLLVAGAVIYFYYTEAVGAVLAGFVGLACIALLGALHRAVSAALKKPVLERTGALVVANALGHELVTAALVAGIAMTITLAYINRPSNTSIAFLQADQNVIQIVASNAGGKPSVVRKAEMKFGRINIEDRQLVIHNVVVPAGGKLRINLLVEGLITRVRPGSGGRFKIAEVLPQLRTNSAKLVIEVDESNGHRIRTESIEGEKLEYLIQHKLVEE